MTEHPILFSGPMVRAILDGRKTQTRRVIKLKQPRKNCVWCKGHGFEFIEAGELSAYDYRRPCRCRFPEPWKKGDRLWVRETHWQYRNRLEVAGYCADDEQTFEHPVNKYPSIFMPHWASRISLEITDVRIERLQDITDNDAQSEGVETDPVKYGDCCYVDAFIRLWDSINGKKYPWSSNPLVWVIEFKRME